jgi:hypothetical protein
MPDRALRDPADVVLHAATDAPHRDGAAVQCRELEVVPKIRDPAQSILLR